METLNPSHLKADTVEFLSTVTLSTDRANAAIDRLPNISISEFADQAVTANGIRMHYVTTGEGVVLEGCGHYLPEECHAEYSKAIFNFWRNNPVR
jgi:pimeloyl-ACP methyl ester carboxylesterase